MADVVPAGLVRQRHPQDRVPAIGRRQAHHADARAQDALHDLTDDGERAVVAAALEHRQRREVLHHAAIRDEPALLGDERGEEIGDDGEKPVQLGLHTSARIVVVDGAGERLQHHRRDAQSELGDEIWSLVLQLVGVPLPVGARKARRARTERRQDLRGVGPARDPPGHRGRAAPEEIDAREQLGELRETVGDAHHTPPLTVPHGRDGARAGGGQSGGDGLQTGKERSRLSNANVAGERERGWRKRTWLAKANAAGESEREERGQGAMARARCAGRLSGCPRKSRRGSVPRSPRTASVSERRFCEHRR